MKKRKDLERLRLVDQWAWKQRRHFKQKGLGMQFIGKGIGALFDCTHTSLTPTESDQLNCPAGQFSANSDANHPESASDPTR